MVREAIRAGLSFDETKLLELNCIEEESGTFGNPDFSGDSAQRSAVPQVQVTGSPTPGGSPTDMTGFTEAPGQGAARSAFRQALIDSATTSKIHDCLKFGGGLKAGSVIWWNMMEVRSFYFVFFL